MKLEDMVVWCKTVREDGGVHGSTVAWSGRTSRSRDVSHPSTHGFTRRKRATRGIF